LCFCWDVCQGLISVIVEVANWDVSLCYNPVRGLGSERLLVIAPQRLFFCRPLVLVLPHLSHGSLCCWDGDVISVIVGANFFFRVMH
jgi:hypothetical protein